VSAGSQAAYHWLEEAQMHTTDRRERAEIAMDLAESYAALFRWVDAVDVIERAIGELGDADASLACRLEAELVVAGLHDARRASLVFPALDRLAARQPKGAEAEALAVGRGMASLLCGAAAASVADLLEKVLSSAKGPVANWDTRAALLWSLVTAECFDTVDNALESLRAEVQQSGSARGLIAVYSTMGLLRLRLGALPEADAAARVALRVLQEGDFVPGLAFAATVLADVAIEAGQFEEAQALIDLLPQEGWSAGVATVLIPAARGRLRLAAGRPADALSDFDACASMFSAQAWGMDLHDVGYVHARSGAAQALLLLGERGQARELAQAEVADMRVFGGQRALGVALRVAGLVEGGAEGLELLDGSVAALRASPAILERAKSLAELGAGWRRAGKRARAREPLAEALDLAARCGARPLASRIRDELKAAGARPRREWRRGVESLTPSELRIAQLAAEGKTNREIAQALYVTMKTVEGHLARVYPKLDIAGRAELADVLRGEKTRVVTR
jgi:DNA-binding CsgD family transcriptional regulator